MANGVWSKMVEDWLKRLESRINVLEKEGCPFRQNEQEEIRSVKEQIKWIYRFTLATMGSAITALIILILK